MIPQLIERFVGDTVESLGFKRFDDNTGRCGGSNPAWRKIKPTDIRIYIISAFNSKIELEFYTGSYPQNRGDIKKELELNLNDPISHEQLVSTVKGLINAS